MKKITTCLLCAAAIQLFIGCQQTAADNTHKTTGHYAGARHMSVGSNIPQRQDVQSTSATYDPDQFANAQSRSAGGFGGGAR